MDKGKSGCPGPTLNHLSDTDNVLPFENTTPIKQNLKKIKKKNAEQVDQINRSGISNAAMLSVSDKPYSVDERTQEISELMKLHIQWVWQNAREFITQLAHF